MKNSRDRILTSQVGSLPRPDNLLERNRMRESGEDKDEAGFQRLLRSAVADVVRRQKDTGIDLPGDGEYGKSMGQKVNYGAWWSYAFQRLSGLELRPETASRNFRHFTSRRDYTKFSAAYTDPESGVTLGSKPASRSLPTCVAPLRYTGYEAVKADIANFKAALEAAGIEEGFMTSIGPGSLARFGNDYYKTEEEFIAACAGAMHEEYKAIIDSGLVLQIDDPGIAESWDALTPEPTFAEYRKYAMVRAEALNTALKGLPQDRVRFHLCWGSWHGPHTTDIPMREIVEVMLAINAQGYLFEAGNVRHEHEWNVWRDVKLPDGKLIFPGVVSHATNVVEHPELVAERILRFANLVGRERVLASTDCGLGGRVHPQIAWAKLEALAQGAAIASRQLWR
jgi:5-methyltetrahydropteroyltriglutamate--homocysteine methyltransferase